MTETDSASEAYWEPYYASGRSRWSGAVNAALAEEVAELEPGRALDLGCGQGGDAIWLAQRGWRVTAVDVSASALAVAAEHAGAAGLAADAITWARHDLAESQPDGDFELVAATYLHSPVALPQARILGRAAEAVSPGGTLLVIGHAPSDEHRHAELQTADEIAAELALPDEAWELVTCEHRSRQHAFRDEQAHTRIDAIVRLRRR
jgi:2-polyprenyl-3-methyl-5-hydroxy-6-metoxy-1,4-benzoquinol methylase